MGERNLHELSNRIRSRGTSQALVIAENRELRQTKKKTQKHTPMTFKGIGECVGCLGAHRLIGGRKWWGT